MALLGGCATVYVPPSNGPVAKIDFQQPRVPSSDRPRTLYSISVPNSRGCLIDAKVAGKDYPRSTTVAAGKKPVVINFEHSFSPNRRDTYICSGWGAFVAEEGVEYVATASLTHTYVERSTLVWLFGGGIQPGDYTCGMTLQRKVESVLIPVLLEKPRVTTHIGFGDCVKLEFQE